MLFHSFNHIRSAEGINHWIPFTEKQVGSREVFASDFMSTFLKDKTLSEEAKLVYESGLSIWKHYFSKSPPNQNVSFYDIKEFFRGRSKGRLKSKGDDEEFERLMDNLREAYKPLSAKIAEKAYEHGFLSL